MLLLFVEEEEGVVPSLLRRWGDFEGGGRMLTIDPSARTSMAHDLDAGRRTEIDHLQGEVLRLARAQGRDLPVMAAITRAIARAEAGEASLPLSPGDIRAG